MSCVCSRDGVTSAVTKPSRQKTALCHKHTREREKLFEKMEIAIGRVLYNSVLRKQLLRTLFEKARGLK